MSAFNNQSLHTAQPSSGPYMTQASQQQQPSLAKAMGTSYMKKAAGEAGSKTVEYESDHVGQQYDDAKAQAQGAWAKYCGCFGSAL